MAVDMLLETFYPCCLCLLLCVYCLLLAHDAMTGDQIFFVNGAPKMASMPTSREVSIAVFP